MKEERAPLYYFVPGLEEAYRDYKKNIFESLLSQIPLGETICINYAILSISSPTTQEVALFVRSLQEHRELGLVTVGEHSVLIEGEGTSVLARDVTTILERFHNLEVERAFAHTHWDDSKDPLPSPADRIQFLIYRIKWPELQYRIIFSLKGEIKVFDYVGEQERLGTT